MGKRLTTKGGSNAKGGDALSCCRTLSSSTLPPLTTFVVVVEKREEEKERGSAHAKGKNREGGGEGGEVVWSGNVQQNARPRTSRLIAVNDRGLAIGESHPRAVLSDHDVGLLLELRDEGYSYGWLAEKFEVSKSCVAKIVRGEHRAQIVVGFRRARGQGSRG